MKIDPALLLAPEEARLLLLPPTPADASAIRKVLEAAGIACLSCRDVQELCVELAHGAAVIMVAEEIAVAHSDALLRCLVNQPVWSDLPVMVLSRAGRESQHLSQLMTELGNATIVERPMRISTLASLISMALRARARQYQLRRHLELQQSVEQSLRDSENRLSLAVRTGRLGVWELDLATMTMQASGQCRVNFGRGEHDAFEYADVWSSMHPDDVERTQLAVRRSIAENADYDVEYRVIWPDGSLHYLLVRGRPEFNDADTPQRMIGVTLDITERRLLEEQRHALFEAERSARTAAERSAQMKDEFVATVSHELRTPLNAILGWSKLLVEKKPDAKRLEQGLNAIERSARSQAQIIQDLLDMSSILSGKMQLDSQRLDLVEVLNTALDIIRPTAEAKGIQLQVSLGAGPVPVRGDDTRLQQVFWNLLSNAVKFTPAGGSIGVTLRHVGESLQVAVTDDGAGIDAAFLPEVFDRFRQADASITRRVGGLGLGLAIVKQLVEHHAGSVHVASEGLGCGASFTVVLPMEGAEAHRPLATADETSAPPLAKPAPRGDHKLRIVVVDDDADSRNFLQRVLEDQKAKVYPAGSAAEAYSLVRSAKPHLLISDIGLPEEDGYSLMRRVRQLPADGGGTIPAIAVTAYARAEDRTLALAAGFQQHVAKPVNTARLFRVIGELVN